MAEIHPSDQWHSQTVTREEQVCTFLTALQSAQSNTAKLIHTTIGRDDVWVIFYQGPPPYKGRGW